MTTSHLPEDAKAYTDFNLVPLPANAVPLSSAFVPNNPCQINSLARLGDLHKFLVQCQDPGYFENYHQLLNSATPDMLQDAYKSLKDRAKWLNDQQNIEFERMRSLDIVPASVGNALNHTLNPTLPAMNSHEPALIHNVIGTTNYANMSATPEIAAVPGLTAVDGSVDGGAGPTALEQQLLVRDSVTPPNFTAVGSVKGTRGRKKGVQAKIKRKRT